MALPLFLQWPSPASGDESSAREVWVTQAEGAIPLGRHLEFLVEAEPLTLAQAHERALSGDFQRTNRRALSFGIGARPVWVRLRINNPDTQAHPRSILAGATWIDRIDFFLLREGQLIEHRIHGDRSRQWQPPVPGLGYVLDYPFAPGLTEVFLRVENPDPMLLPVHLLTPESSASTIEKTQYSYGAVYGFILALLAYNFMLYLGLGRPSHRDYSIYLGLFILMNMAYTGHGYAWLWPQANGFQQYVILVLMVLFAAAGLHFASGFLDLKSNRPRLARSLRVGSGIMLALMALLVTLDLQTAAAILSFSVALLFSIILLGLGWLALLKGYTGARYFMLAAFSGIVGIVSTTLNVWGWVPYTTLGFRAVEFGLLLEATLFALAVAYLVREHDRARRQAERLARIDALTGLLNRRALMEQGDGIWNTAQRSGRALSVILLDLDHFKLINDAYGHAVGDRVLMETASIIQENCRSGDLAARWGGEEFILLLPDAGRQEARALAERLRDAFAGKSMSGEGATIALRASFGVATLDQHDSLVALIKEADDFLYLAKREGRDQIRSAEGLPVRARPA